MLFKYIIQDVKEPNPQNLWLDNGVLKYHGPSGWKPIGTDIPEYTIPIASDTTRGGINIGYKENSKNYAVKLDSNGKAYVTVNWSDTNTTYTEATTTKSGLMSSSDKSKLDGIANNANNYVLPSASTSTLGGVKQGASVLDITIDGSETAATVGEKVNELLTSLRKAGIINE